MINERINQRNGAYVLFTLFCSLMFCIVLAGLMPNGKSKILKEVSVEELVEKELNKNFSPLDGANFPLELVIKKHLVDPDSYQHIETRYNLVSNNQSDPHLVLYTKFRAKNSLGGYSVATAKAKYNLITEKIYSIEIK